jgi:pantoate--beta-alanine ligase
MYPSGITADTAQQRGTFVHVQGLAHQLEGSIRPHFFRGVTTVVNKLLNIVTPERLYLGQKDAQQCVVVRRMIQDLLMDVELVVGETVREPNGLAMSSRNQYLSTERREQAGAIYGALMRAHQLWSQGETDGDRLISRVRDALKDVPFPHRIEYISLSDPVELSDVSQVDDRGAILSLAVQVDDTRLIDNILLGCRL